MRKIISDINKTIDTFEAKKCIYDEAIRLDKVEESKAIPEMEDLKNLQIATEQEHNREAITKGVIKNIEKYKSDLKGFIEQYEENINKYNELLGTYNEESPENELKEIHTQMVGIIKVLNKQEEILKTSINQLPSDIADQLRMAEKGERATKRADKLAKNRIRDVKSAVRNPVDLRAVLEDVGVSNVEELFEKYEEFRVLIEEQKEERLRIGQINFDNTIIKNLERQIKPLNDAINEIVMDSRVDLNNKLLLTRRDWVESRPRYNESFKNELYKAEKRILNDEASDQTKEGEAKIVESRAIIANTSSEYRPLEGDTGDRINTFCNFINLVNATDKYIKNPEVNNATNLEGELHSFTHYDKSYLDPYKLDPYKLDPYKLEKQTLKEIKAVSNANTTPAYIEKSYRHIKLLNGIRQFDNANPESVPRSEASALINVEIDALKNSESSSELLDSIISARGGLYLLSDVKMEEEKKQVWDAYYTITKTTGGVRTAFANISYNKGIYSKRQEAIKTLSDKLNLNNPDGNKATDDALKLDLERKLITIARKNAGLGGMLSRRVAIKLLSEASKQDKKHLEQIKKELDSSDKVDEGIARDLEIDMNDNKDLKR